jgi:hypothetical protein
LEVLVDPHFPLSGYPTKQFFWDLHNSWPLWYWQGASFAVLWFYLISACLTLDIDLDYPPEELIIPSAIIFLGPTLLLPHASVWRRNAYHKYLLRLYGTGNIVDRRVEEVEEVKNLNSIGPDEDDNSDEYDEYSCSINSEDSDCDDKSNG